MKKIYSKAVILFFLLGLLSACSNSTENNNKITVSDIPSDTVVDSFTYNYYSINSSEEFRLIDGFLYGRGNNYNELFGQDSSKFYDSYIKLAGDVIHFESNYGIVLYLTKDFKVYGLGVSSNPILLTDDTADESIITTPKLLFEDCKYFSLGSNFVLAIKNDNSLWFWGESKAGQGCKISEYMLEPYKIADKVKFAKAFLYNSAWIDDKDSLYIVGSNAFNQIGNGKNGRGIAFLYDDAVSEPYRALENCKSFSVSEDFVIRAVTNDGIEYIWGNHHKPVPTKITDEFPERIKDIELTNSKVILSNEYGVLRFENSPLYFYCEDGNIYKKYGHNSDEKIVKSNISNSVLSSIGDGLLAVSCTDDDCVYLISYKINEKGEMHNIKWSLLYENYALPVYVKDSSHLVLGLPQSYRELILDTHNGEVQEGEFWDYSKLDNRPNIEPSEAENIALKELCNTKYINFDEKEHDFSSVESTSIVLQPNFQRECINSWTTPEFFENKDFLNWCYHIRILDAKNEHEIMEMFIDANTGDVYFIANIYN